MSSLKPIPEGAHTVSAHLVVRNGRDAIEFYKAAFGAEELGRQYLPDGQTLLHATLRFGDSIVFLCDEMPMMGHCRSPQSLGGTSITLHIWSEDVDAAVERAVKAGARISMPVMDMFWGDRYGKVTDPFGHEWSVATHVRDMSPDEIAKAADETMKMMGM